MIKTHFFFLLTVFLLSGCLTSNSPSPTYYVMHPQSIDQADKKGSPASIIIDRPDIVSGLGSDRIALLKNNVRELDYFAQARWNGSLDDIIQDFMIESFENNYDIVEVDTTRLHQAADYLILTKVRDFQAEYNDGIDNPPTLNVTLVVSVLQLPEKKIVTRIIETQNKVLEANSMAAIVEGFEELLQEGIRNILNQISQDI